MILLDENIPESQRQLLRSWRIRARQVGHEVGPQGVKDEALIPLLHHERGTTFFTRDLGFYERRLCHADYCLVCLEARQYETASFIRRFLRHPQFRTQRQRLGSMVRVSHTAIHLWRLGQAGEEAVDWGG